LSTNFYRNTINTPVLSDVHFKTLLKNNILREAVYLASPELYGQIIKWENGLLKDVKRIKKLQFSILKYVTRITTRCTPFGLFAACTVGEFDSATTIKLKNSNEYKRFTRFDTTFLTQLFRELLNDKAIKKHVLFYPNTSLYKISDHYRYIEYSVEKKLRNYTLEGLIHSEYISKILKYSHSGKTITDLATLLLDDAITQPETKDFIEELIENQILVSEFEITVTGTNYFDNLLERIKDIPEVSKAYKQLTELKNNLINLDQTIGNNPGVYQSSIELARQLAPALDVKYLFQVDCFSDSSKNNLDNSIKKQLQKALVLFNKMTLPSASGNLEHFKTQFTKRFEQSEVPLCLALDAETGIGFGSENNDTNPLLDDLSLQESQKRYERIIWTDVDTILQKKLVYANKNKHYNITLTESDFEHLPLNFDDLPDTFSSLIEIYNSNIFIDSIGGASATNLLGRFCYGNQQLLNHVNYITNIEKRLNKDKILAEIVHLPDARAGNILQRPNIRAYEIPYLGKSSVKKAHQIPIDDLMISVKNNTIVLRSEHLNKEILPRLGNAHNYSYNALPIYHFLCELQTQQKRSSIGFNWNTILKKQTFLPRVEFENIIFSKARWTIETKTIKLFFESDNLLAKVQKWKDFLMIPDDVELVEGDNKLLINLKNETSIKMLLDTVKNKKQFLLDEFLFTDNTVVKNKDGGSSCNQFVISFYNDKKLQSFKND
jgi:hypothetical protein